MRSLLDYFQELSRVPRPSFHMEEISAFLVSFANERGLTVSEDSYHNVIINKKGLGSGAASRSVILQAHMDMVPAFGPSGSDHDFSRDPILLAINGDIVRSAEDTTLGADDGIGMAMMLSLLDRTEGNQPPLACVFTTDEEVGLIGARNFEPFETDAAYMINLDNEEEHHICVGCAGGCMMRIKKNMPLFPVKEGRIPMTVRVKGLAGGHSGISIGEYRANACLIIGRILSLILKEDRNMQIMSVSGGTVDNAIPSFATADFACENPELFREKVLSLFEKIKREYSKTDPGMELTLTELEDPEDHDLMALTEQDTREIIQLIRFIPNGVAKGDDCMGNTVNTSSNLGVLSFVRSDIATEFEAIVSVRSNTGSAKEELIDRIMSLATLLRFRPEIESEYPEWEMKEDSVLRTTAERVHRELYGTDPVTEVIHAGLECAWFSRHFPEMDMIAMGPDLFEVHTPGEHMSISSAERTFEFLKRILEALV